MKVLLDECLPHRLAYHLRGHEVIPVQRAGWSGKRNGELLRLAALHFDIFLTVDRNLKYQQNLGAVDIAVIVLASPSNSYEALMPMMPQVADAADRARPGEVVQIPLRR